MNAPPLLSFDLTIHRLLCPRSRSLASSLLAVPRLLSAHSSTLISIASSALSRLLSGFHHCSSFRFHHHHSRSQSRIIRDQVHSRICPYRHCILPSLRSFIATRSIHPYAVLTLTAFIRLPHHASRLIPRSATPCVGIYSAWSRSGHFQPLGVNSQHVTRRHTTACQLTVLINASTTSSTKSTIRTRRQRPTTVSAVAAQAAVLVSSILVSSPAMIAPVRAREDSYREYAFGSSSEGKQRDVTESSIASSADSADSHGDDRTPSQSTSSIPSRRTTSTSHDRRSISLDDIDDHLPANQHSTSPSPIPLHRQYPRQYDDEAALFGERDPSMSIHPLQFEDVPGTKSWNSSRATATAHRYSLPSTYPSSIASSWSRPERSVWFSRKPLSSHRASSLSSSSSLLALPSSFARGSSMMS